MPMTGKEHSPMTGDRRHLIFISYRGSDQNWATEFVYARMTDAFGSEAVFKAGNSLRFGEDYPSALRREASSCPVMLACIGPGWLTAAAADGRRRLDSPDDWVRAEITISLRAGNHLVPLLLGNRNDVAMPEPSLVPEPIRAMVYRQALWLAPGRGLDATIPALIDQLTELVPELAERRRDRSAAGMVLRSLAPTEDADQLNRLIEAGQIDQAVDLLRAMVREETSLIYIVRGKDEGRPAWHFVKIDHSKLASFKQALLTGSLNASDYGEILHSGFGENPPEEIMREVTEKYGK
jgi:TIR domain